MTHSVLAEQAVNGVPKPIGEIDDNDEAHMTAEEYEVSTVLPCWIKADSPGVRRCDGGCLMARQDTSMRSIPRINCTICINQHRQALIFEITDEAHLYSRARNPQTHDQFLFQVRSHQHQNMSRVHFAETRGRMMMSQSVVGWGEVPVVSST